MIETYFEIKKRLEQFPTGSFAVLKKAEHDQIRSVFVYDKATRKVLRKYHDGNFHDDCTNLFSNYWQGISVNDFSFYCASIDVNLNLTFNKERE